MICSVDCAGSVDYHAIERVTERLFYGTIERNYSSIWKGVFQIFNERIFQEIIDAFTVNTEELQQVASAFRRDMAMGLSGEEMSSLRMLKSYVGLPSGEETGEFLALDFGGTNVRVLLIRLLGGGKYEVVRKAAKPLTVPGVYDFVGVEAAAADLFDFIAGMVDEVVGEDRAKEFLLGHTFSFPSKQTDLYNAKLITWTKEFAVRGVEGKVVNDLLTEALQRNGVRNVRPVAVINDTVATLLAAAYKNASTYIGSIYATGHNTAYLEPYEGEAKPRMILNMESGGFNKLLPNKYDRILDEMSEKPGEQRLEKMVSGRYLGVLFGMALADGLAEKSDFAFTSVDLSAILSDQSMELIEVKRVMKEKIGADFVTQECEWIKAVAEMVVIRSARLVAATYVGVIWHLNGDNVNAQKVAIDGSLYEKMPLGAETIRKVFYELLGEDAQTVETVLENSGSGVGAAIAAAL